MIVLDRKTDLRWSSIHGWVPPLFRISSDGANSSVLDGSTPHLPEFEHTHPPIPLSTKSSVQGTKTQKRPPISFGRRRL
jgi:hypothetical protein